MLEIKQVLDHEDQLFMSPELSSWGHGPRWWAPAPFWESRRKIHFLERFWQTVNLLRHNVKLSSDS
jgi:hypothetical protein